MSENNICDKIENDEFFQTFLKDKADLKNASTTSSNALSLAEQIKKLTEGLDAISVELQTQVREQYGALLSQASHAGRLDSALNEISAHMEKIQNSANRLQNQFNTQYNLIENQTKVLNRLHDASHVLRSCNNFLHLTNKLRNTKEYDKQALYLFELEALTEDPQLSQIELIKDEYSFVMSTRQKLNNMTQLDLINGLKNKNEAQITKSLQIFINLQTIDKCIENLIETFINEITHSIKECFAGTDLSALCPQKSQSTSELTTSNLKDGNRSQLRGPGKIPTLTTSQNFRAKLMKSLHWLIYDELHEYCDQILLLQKCLNNINDHMSSSDSVQKKFWERIEKLFIISFTECPSHISQCLQEGLPTLLSAARGLQKKCYSKFIFSDKIFESLEPGYLTKCGTNLKTTLISVDTITKETIDNIIKSATNELSDAMVDNRLSLLVAEVFNACNNDFWTKIESYVKLGADAQQVVDNPNSSQMQNINLANLIFYHSENVKRLSSNLGDSFMKSQAAESILKNLERGKRLSLAILQQLIDSMISTIGIILLSMHREPGLNSEKISITGPSLYMKEFNDFLMRSWNLHIQPFDDKETTQKCGEQLATRCIELFVNNVAILRPISSNGRARLKNDCLHLEIAINSIINNQISTLGKPFRLLKAISSLITQPPEVLIKQEVEPESPVPSYIILFLLFGHCGNELQSPHNAANWSNERLIQWLDGHTSEKERLELIAGGIQKYRDSVRRRNSTQYDPVFPHLSSYFEKVYKAIH